MALPLVRRVTPVTMCGGADGLVGEHVGVIRVFHDDATTGTAT